jgi:hypothetical protein
MAVEYVFWVNVILAGVLGLWILRDRRTIVAISALLIYGTLHFSGGALLFFFSRAPMEIMLQIHSQPVIRVKLVGAAFVGFFLLLQMIRCRGAILARFSKGTWLAGGVCLGLILAGALLRMREGLLLSSAENVAPVVLVPLIVLLTYVGWQRDSKGYVDRLLPVVGFLTIAVVLVGILELTKGYPWSTNLLPSGRIQERASSLLFNPNVLGMWCAGVAVFAGYFCSRSGGRGWAVAVPILAGIGLLASASRTGLMLYLVMVLLVAVHPAGRAVKALVAPAFFLGTLLAVGGGTMMLDQILRPAPRPVGTLAVLFYERMISFPLDLFRYVTSRVGFQNSTSQGTAPKVQEAPPEPEAEVPPEVGQEAPPESEVFASAVGGRFGQDNAYVTILADAGWLGLAGWLCLIALIVWFWLRPLWRRGDWEAAYSFAAATGCILSGMFLKTFQVFPLWVFVAAGLATVFINATNEKRVYE